MAKTVLDVLQEAVHDYNTWASVKGHGYDPIRDNYNLRGIFYNKLLGILLTNASSFELKREITYRKQLVKTIIFPDDFACTFIEHGYLVSLDIPNLQGLYKYYSGYDRLKVLELLYKELPSVRFSTKDNTMLEWRLSKIVDDFKKLIHVNRE